MSEPIVITAYDGPRGPAGADGTNGSNGSNGATGPAGTPGMQVVYHGSNAAFPRPPATVVMWVGTVNPANRIAGDVFANASPAALPDVVVWSDSFTTDGALGTTEVGGKPWSVLGTGYAAARVGGQLRFTAGTTSVGLAVADSGVADGIYEITVATKGANNQSGIVWRVQDLNNHLGLVRVSSGDSHYRVVKRAAGVYTLVTGATTTVSMADGDVVRVQLTGTTTTVFVNNVQAWTGTIPEYVTATKFGAYCGASTSFAEMAYDAAKFTVPA